MEYEKESTLTNRCCDYLNKMQTVTAIITPNKGAIKSGGRRGKAKRKGIADIHACIRGRFVAIENKLPGKRQSKDQLEYEQDVIKSGGIYWVITSISELRNELIDLDIYLQISRYKW